MRAEVGGTASAEASALIARWGGARAGPGDATRTGAPPGGLGWILDGMPAAEVKGSPPRCHARREVKVGLALLDGMLCREVKVKGSPPRWHAAGEG